MNPPWVEWLMGWPIGWTDLKPLAMDKFRQWLHSHGRHLPEGDNSPTGAERTECPQNRT